MGVSRAGDWAPRFCRGTIRWYASDALNGALQIHGHFAPACGISTTRVFGRSISSRRPPPAIWLISAKHPWKSHKCVVARRPAISRLAVASRQYNDIIAGHRQAHLILKPIEQREYQWHKLVNKHGWHFFIIVIETHRERPRAHISKSIKRRRRIAASAKSATDIIGHDSLEYTNCFVK